MTTKAPPAPPTPSRVRRVDTGNAAKRHARRSDRTVFIPPPVDRGRRQRFEDDDINWLMYYFGPGTGEVGRYTYEFTRQQCEMTAAIARAISEGGDQAIAASRGEGKSTLAWRLTLKYVLQGKLSFAVLFASTGTAAANTLEELKYELEHNPRLREDYPEVVFPVLALEGVPQRAATMLATGKRHDTGEAYECVQIKFAWCGQEIYMPDVPGSPSRGSIFATRGLDAEVRGLRIRGRRVDLALIDDPDTEETARSEEQAEKLEKRIERAIAGLGSQQKTTARVMLTTIQSLISVSYKFTDPAQKQSWRGKRYRMLVQPPENLDLWQTFLMLWQQDQADGTNKAHEFYVENRERMDQGAIVANPNRRMPGQLSALEHYFSLVARYGIEAVDTEYNNDPPKPSEVVDLGITPRRVQRQVSGYDRQVIPEDCTVLVQGMDVKKQALHWVVRTFRADGTGFTIDYGVKEVLGTRYGSEEGVEEAIRRAIIARMEEFAATEYHTPDGEVPEFERLTLCDTRYQGDAVKLACVEIGSSIMPVMGVGLSKGCGKTRLFSHATENTSTRKRGDHYNTVLTHVGQQKLWMVEADTDHWKRWEHDRWMTGPDRPGRMSLFGKEDANSQRFGGMSRDQYEHHAYAMHVTNEKEIDEPYKGGFRKVWRVRAGNVHWLDASYYSNVAARIRGITILKPVELVKPPVRRKRRFYELS